MKSSLYRPELDQLRFMAFLAVFISHGLPYDAASYTGQGMASWLSPWLGSMAMAGAFGVDLFFTLSAYLISHLLLQERRQTGRIHLRSFWLRRILRIWPLYFVFILLSQTLFAYWFDQRLTAGYLLSFLLLGGNWAFAFWGPASSVASPLWSVSIEEQFYLLWPLILQRLNLKQIRNLCWLLILASSLSRACASLLELPHSFFWCSTFTRLDPIATGILLAIHLDGKSLQLPKHQRWLLFACGLLLPVIALRYAGIEAFTGWGTLWLHPVASLASLCLLLGVLHSKERSDSKLGQFGCYLGRISYGLYVFHLLGLKLGSLLVKQSWWPTPVVFGLDVLLGLLLSLVFASLSYQYLERPFLRLKARYTWVKS